MFVSKILAAPSLATGSDALFWASAVCSAVGLIAAVFGPDRRRQSTWVKFLVVACAICIPQTYRDGSRASLLTIGYILSVALLFDFLLYRSLRLFKKTFSFGEAMVVMQALSMYTVDGAQRFLGAFVARITSSSTGAQEVHEERVVMQGGILCVLLSVAIVGTAFPARPICSEKQPDMQRLMRFWCALAGSVVGLLTLWMVSVW
jgi:hypothetical protein